LETAMHKLNIFSLDYEYVSRDPEGYRAGLKRFGYKVGAKMMGATAYELPQGESICPNHYHYGNEEWLLVLDGSPVVRTDDGEERLVAGDAVCFRAGPKGVHKVNNPGPDTAHVMMLSTRNKPSVAVYPDSDKVAIWPGDKRDDLMLRRGARAGYWEGE
jgi:Uncharacterized conserved protein, contains double-stranded beta-helix domain